MHSLLPTNITTGFALYYGRAYTPLAMVVPDSRWLGMWRIAWPDGRLSDMVNQARAKDAAVAICALGPPARDRRRLHWKTERPITAREASPARSVRAGLPGGHPASQSASPSHHHRPSL